MHSRRCEQALWVCFTLERFNDKIYLTLSGKCHTFIVHIKLDLHFRALEEQIYEEI